jgi:hypothetical protein
MSLRIDRTRFRESSPLPRFQRDPDLLRNRPGDLVLQQEDVLQIALVFLAPDRMVGGRIDELGHDPNPVAGAHDRALDERVHAQLPGDLRDGLLRLLVPHRGSPGDHAQRIDLPEIGDQSVGHAVGEILLPGISREVRQWKNGQRSNAARLVCSEEPLPNPSGMEQDRRTAGEKQGADRDDEESLAR